MGHRTNGEPSWRTKADQRKKRYKNRSRNIKAVNERKGKRNTHASDSIGSGSIFSNSNAPLLSQIAAIPSMELAEFPAFIEELAKEEHAAL